MIVVELAKITPQRERALTILIFSLKYNVLHHVSEAEEPDACWGMLRTDFEAHNGARAINLEASRWWKDQQLKTSSRE